MSAEIKLGYKMTEVGVIPEDWDVSPLVSLASIVTGCTPPTSAPQNYGDDFLFVGPGDLGITKYIFKSAKSLSTKGWSLARKLPADSVLFTCIGSTIGKVGLAAEQLATNQQINSLIPAAEHSSEFIYYALYHASNRIRGYASEQAVPLINKTDFSNALISHPSREEQVKIASTLSDVDALITGLDKLIVKKRDLKQAAMQQLLTGQKRLPGFSGEWEVKSFSQVLTRVNAKAYQVQTADYQTNGKYPIVDQGKDLVVGFSDNEEKLFHHPDGGVIVFGDHTCIVKFVDFDFLVGADGTQVLHGIEGQNTRFHAFQLQYRGIESTGYNRHFKFLKERTFHVAPLDEQTAIATILSDMDAELAALEARRDKARQLKQGMMQELLTGRIRLLDPQPTPSGLPAPELSD